MDALIEQASCDFSSLREFTEKQVQDLKDEFSELADKINDELSPLIESYGEVATSASNNESQAVRLIKSVIANSCNQINSSNALKFFKLCIKNKLTEFIENG